MKRSLQKTESDSKQARRARYSYATKPTNASTNMADFNSIIDFYDPQIGATCDQYQPLYTLTNMLGWSSRKLERKHDYIQHLFPLPEPSPFNSSATTLAKAVRDEFLARPELQVNLRKALDLMCNFYGFEPQGSSVDFSLPRSEDFDDASENWLRYFDHNHLRITRIIRSIRILGLVREAQIFYETLVGAAENAGRIINDKSIRLWRHAALGPLHVPPSDSDRIVEWLREESVEPENGEAETDDHERTEPMAMGDETMDEIKMPKKDDSKADNCVENTGAGDAIAPENDAPEQKTKLASDLKEDDGSKHAEVGDSVASGDDVLK